MSYTQCVGLAVITLFAAAGHANIDQAINPGDRNLTRLAATLNSLQREGAPQGDLVDVLTSLNQSSSAPAVRQSLRTLLPAIERARARREQASNRGWRATSRVGVRNPPRRAPLHSQVLNFDKYGPVALAPAEQPGPWGRDLWMQAWTDDAEQNPDDRFNGFSADQTGVSIGMDFSVSEQFSFGLSLGGFTGEVDSNVFGEDDLDGRQMGLSATWTQGSHALSTHLTYGEDDIDRVRLMLVPTPDGIRSFRLASDIDADQTTYGLVYSYSVLPDPLSARSYLFTPFVGINYTTIKTDDYIESGSDTLSLRVQTDDEEHITGQAGASFAWAWFNNNWTLLPSISLAFEHDFQADPTSTTSRFRNTMLTFDTEGVEIEENRWRYTVGMTLLHGNNVGIGLSYQGQRKGDYEYDSVVLNFHVGI